MEHSPLSLRLDPNSLVRAWIGAWHEASRGTHRGVFMYVYMYMYSSSSEDFTAPLTRPPANSSPPDRAGFESSSLTTRAGDAELGRIRRANGDHAEHPFYQLGRSW
jgi:hypothetical protein